MATTDEIFDSLINPDNDCVKACLEQLEDQPVNAQVLTYLLNVHLYHESSKIRARAEALFEANAPQDLIELVAANWKLTLRRHQEIRPLGDVLAHPAVDMAELVVIAQVTRKNFFRKNKQAGMNSYAVMKYGTDISNVLTCCSGADILKLPDRITRLQHIEAATFVGQPALDWHDTVEKLSSLPALQYFGAYQSGLQLLPDNFSKLQSLRTLELHFNPLEKIDQRLTLPKLKYLGISHTKVSALDLRQFPALETLTIDDPRRLDNFSFQNVTRPFLATSGPNGFKQQIPVP